MFAITLLFSAACTEPVEGRSPSKDLDPSNRLHQQSWGATDFRLADPDGYSVRVTSR